MKILHYLILILILSCNNNNIRTNSNLDKNINCSDKADSLMLKYSAEFNPTQIDLSKDISDGLDSLLLQTDSSCLRQQESYQLFISTILAKLFYFHLYQGHQGYDLRSMERGGAKRLIQEFERMAGYSDTQPEMINSGAIMNYIEKNKRLKENSVLIALKKRIDQQAIFIEKQAPK